MTMVIQNRSWRDRRDWRDRCRRFAWAAQDVAERKRRQRQEWEARCEAAAEEFMFERHCW
jgi:hypothetical protein